MAFVFCRRLALQSQGRLLRLLPIEIFFSTSSLGSGLVPTRCLSEEVMYVCGPRLGLSERLIARAVTEKEERQVITGSGSPGFLTYP